MILGEVIFPLQMTFKACYGLAVICMHMVVLERELECHLAVTSKDQVTLVLNDHYLLNLVL